MFKFTRKLALIGFIAASPFITKLGHAQTASDSNINNDQKEQVEAPKALSNGNRMLANHFDFNTVKNDPSIKVNMDELKKYLGDNITDVRSIKTLNNQIMNIVTLKPDTIPGSTSKTIENKRFSLTDASGNFIRNVGGQSVFKDGAQVLMTMNMMESTRGHYGGYNHYTHINIDKEFIEGTIESVDKRYREIIGNAFGGNMDKSRELFHAIHNAEGYQWKDHEFDKLPYAQGIFKAMENPTMTIFSQTTKMLQDSRSGVTDNKASVTSKHTNAP